MNMKPTQLYASDLDGNINIHLWKMGTVQGYYTLLRMFMSIGPGLYLLSLFNRGLRMERSDITDKDGRVHSIEPYRIENIYDFVIVGGGSAGAALAARLSEIPNWKVLLLEAGPDEPAITDVPLLYPVLQGSRFDWQFKTEPSNQYCLSMENKQCHWPRAKCLGGCSVLNALLYVRGNRRDYDYWAEQGNYGWNYDNILYYFKKLEDMRIQTLQNSPYHSVGGPITVEHFKFVTPLVDFFMEAGRELNLVNPYNDMNGWTQTGFARAHGSIRDGLRCSAAKGYLRPVHGRPNLHISLNTFVRKVEIDPETKIATSVRFEVAGIIREVYVRKEIILSAGAVQTPQLLMVSGVGPKSILQNYRIPLIQHLPGVGENLQDHIAAGGANYLINNDFTNQPLSYIVPRLLNIPNMEQFVFHKKGALYANPVCEVMGYISTIYQDSSLDWPDIQLFMASYGYNSDGGLFGVRGSGISFQAFGEVFEPVLYKDSFMIIPLVMRPKSRGRIVIRSADPRIHPQIIPNYFEHPIDLAILVEGLKFTYAVSQTKIFQHLNATLNPYTIMACPNQTYLSDDFWACLARHFSQTIYHPSGTCKMGVKEDPMAVVDPRLRVHGITGLRVVDASIMPNIVSGNTNIPTIMIAEKAADMIKEEYYHYYDSWNMH